MPPRLSAAGIDVHALALRGDFLLDSGHLAGSHHLHPQESPASALAGVCRDVEPDFVLPGCDASAAFLHSLALDPQAPPALATTLRRSLGDPGSLRASRSKRLTVSIAREAGVRVPAERDAASAEDVRRFAAQHGWPVVLKKEFGAAGRGVRICGGEAEIAGALAALSARGPSRELPAISVQEFLDGPVAMQAVFAVGGVVHERLAARKLEQHPRPTGPSSVVQLLHDPGVDEAVARLVRAFGFTGVGAADLVLDAAGGPPWLLEFNPRPTPIVHAGHRVGRDLLAAIAAHLRGVPYASGPWPSSPVTLALFPQERIRDAASPWLARGLEDLPEDDPGLREALERRADGRPGWAHQFVRDDR